jgi:hypothetical protein
VTIKYRSCINDFIFKEKITHSRNTIKGRGKEIEGEGEREVGERVGKGAQGAEETFQFFLDFRDMASTC